MRIAAFLFLALIGSTSAAENPQNEVVPATILTADQMFDPDRIIEIQINLPVADWKMLCSQNRSFGDTLSSGPRKNPFTYVSADITIDGNTIKGVGIRKKGLFGSMDDRRPSLKVKFDEFVKRSMPITGLEKLTLNNNKQDTGLLSQYMAYRIFRDAGLAAPRCSLVRLTVNGEFLGVYSNVESVEQPFLDRNFKDGAGRLYEGTIADLFDGKMDAIEGKTKSSDNREKLERLAQTLKSVEPVDVESLEKLVDLDAFYKYWAIECLIGFWDGYTNNQNNYFMYELPNDGRFVFIPWGADSTLANIGPAMMFQFGPKSIKANSTIANRLARNERTRERYRIQLIELLKTVWNEDALIAEIDRVERLIGDNVDTSQHGYHDALNAMRDFIKGRRAEMTAELDAWPPKLPSRPRKPMYMVKVGRMAGSFSTRWFSNLAKPAENKVGTTEIEIEVNSETVVIEEVSIRAGRPVFRFPGAPPVADDGNKDRPDPRPSSIAITGKRKGNRRDVNINLMIANDQFQSGKVVDVQGMYSEGQPGIFGGTFYSLVGTLKLDSAGQNDQDPVEGNLELKINQMKGDFGPVME